MFPELAPREGRLELLCQLVGTQVPEAMYLLQHLQDSLAGPGDVCEMGVAYGNTSALLASEILETERTLWLYDSFEQGLSVPTAEDVLIDDIFELGSMESYAHTMSSTVEEVRARVDAVGLPLERVRIVPGYIRGDLGPGGEGGRPVHRLPSGPVRPAALSGAATSCPDPIGREHD